MAVRATQDSTRSVSARNSKGQRRHAETGAARSCRGDACGSAASSRAIVRDEPSSDCAELRASTRSRGELPDAACHAAAGAADADVSAEAAEPGFQERRDLAVEADGDEGVGTTGAGGVCGKDELRGKKGGKRSTEAADSGFSDRAESH